MVKLIFWLKYVVKNQLLESRLELMVELILNNFGRIEVKLLVVKHPGIIEDHLREKLLRYCLIKLDKPEIDLFFILLR